MSTAPRVSSKEEGAILKRIEEFLTAWNTHNPRAMSMAYAEDGDLINPFGRVAKSRTEIEALLKDEHSGVLKDSHLSLKSEGLRFLASDVVVTDHAFEVTGARDRSGKEMTLRGHLTLALKKQGDTWMVAVSRPAIPASNPDAR